MGELQNYVLSKITYLGVYSRRTKVSQENLKFCSWTTFFSTKLRFLHMNYSKNCQIRIHEVVLQLRFLRQILPLLPISLVLEKSEVGVSPIEFLKYWSCPTFFFKNLFFITILRGTFFLMKFWSFYQLLSLDEFPNSPILIKTMIFGHRLQKKKHLKEIWIFVVR